VDAVNAKGGFGRWCCDVVYEMAKMQDVVMLHGVQDAARTEVRKMTWRWHGPGKPHERNEARLLIGTASALLGLLSVVSCSDPLRGDGWVPEAPQVAEVH